LNPIVDSGHLEKNPSGVKKNIWGRIWKYKLHYIIVLPALLLIFIFKGLPFIQGVRMAFVDYKIFAGLAGSDDVGWANFSALWDDPAFVNALSNTFAIKLEYMAAGGVLAFLLALGLSHIRSGRWRSALSALFMAPYFIPSVVLAYATMLVLSPDHSPLFRLDVLVLGDTRFYRPMLVSVEVLKTVGIPVLVALAAIQSRSAAAPLTANYLHTHIAPAVRSIAAFMLVQLSAVLTTDFELASSLLNPLIYEVGDTLETYNFRVGFVMAEYSRSSAVWLLQFVVQLICTVLAYMLIRGLFSKDLFSMFPAAQTKRSGGSGGFAGAILSVIYAIVPLVLLFIVLVYPFTVQSASGISLWEIVSKGNVLPHLYTGLLSVIGFLFITLTLAYPLTVKDLPGRGLYKLVLMAVMTLGGATIPEYMLFHSMGMINTVFPTLFGGIFSIISVFVLKSIFNSKYSDLKRQAAEGGLGELHALFYLFIPKIWKPLLALGVLQFVTLWNSYIYSLIYTANEERFSPTMLFRTISVSGGTLGIPPGDPIIMRYGALICVPSLLLLLLFRRWLTSEVFMSQSRNL